MANQDKEEQLIKKEKELKEHLEGLREVDPQSDEFRHLDNNPEDDSDEAESGNRFAAARRVIKEQLRQVSNAIHKVRQGSYAVCDRCGKRISDERLEAVPEATYCIDCERELENQVG
mgnify:FL=1